ncbi:(ZYRO0B09966g) [Zygosaccharomyces parabailii]|uniref:BN860_08856g1_1 n=1 Tax=Zygosaccharomyces bailii (strain CLIB 213 / ATCC 58445 / CBS 680 / BCRC 21525 / NBRC 1098 / NCYC 1416 / NRRL Y-2227) TaxID=1333698 RepID=A0A8J2WWW4_ZYGB2|nr:(ZYRO0B09966g) [Zygosaccharomyces parabailii]CDF88379.1 BN860_08856g1_1 [Zygosaccharomyces bailii CLIB 213]CDH14739.1 uncharacterized protein ZBAI_06525 [Zygosaccharomyces bailii ISA1307]SJM82005.1 uncharacterized protein ZBIST_0247 [Zygosaccharomyces bailii]
MVRVLKYDPSCSGKGRARPSLCLQRKYKSRKGSDYSHNSPEATRDLPPILFHNIRVAEMTNSLKLERITEGCLTASNAGMKTPLVIKTDPKYNNSHVEISVSSKKLNDYASIKSRKLTFVPSMSNRTPLSEQELSKLRDSDTIRPESSSESGTLTKGLSKFPNSSMTKNYSTALLRTGPEGRNSSDARPNLTNLPFSGRKFNSDVRLKLSRKNAELQPIQGYSTCTFRVKMNGQNKLEQKR